MKEDLLKGLSLKANIIRREVVKMIGQAGSGHPGGSLSCADIIACLFFHHLRHNPANPKWEQRDRFILSKGHACPALYAALAEAGYFPRSVLATLRKPDSILQGHPDSTKTPGVEVPSGSLGQGLSAGVGMALASKLDGDSFRVYVLLGDGELQEGLVWEAAMAAAHYKLDNLTAIVDRNGLQIDGPTEEVMCVEPLEQKWAAFGWNVIAIDGHNLEQIISALEQAGRTKGKPTVIIAHTIKGKGVSFMENVVDFHGKAPTPEQTEKALRELEAILTTQDGDVR